MLLFFACEKNVREKSVFQVEMADCWKYSDIVITIIIIIIIIIIM